MNDSEQQSQPKGAPLPLSSGEASTSYINDGDHFEITIKFAPEKHSQSWLFRQDTTFEDILMALGHQWPDYDFLKSKAIVEKRQSPSSTTTKTKSLLKTPDDDNLPMQLYAGNSLRFMAPKKSALESLHAASASIAKREAALQAQRRMAYKGGQPSASSGSRGGIHTINGPSSDSSSGDTRFTFQTIRPLPHLPNPSRSLSFLNRLAADPGIRAAMRAHQFTVGLLTEMDPGQYTASNHEGTTRILGLNRNKGEVIELRLRTDAYDGYRDYKTIRKTLCHELAHNVHGEHDRQFWDLCKQIEREVERADYTKSGRVVGGEEYEYGGPAPVNEPDDEEGAVYDHGGWTGGTYFSMRCTPVQFVYVTYPQSPMSIATLPTLCEV
ncbi:WLM-domain-containing protein [Neurospora tetraspora]|uniref:WLM-domain-containing protein n=1 Tax=Neurospora tetraspora TaxID=94610 RepID=A0AAE0JF68_9PEZI|nr:WLM-domain-containing protein [Neurospora tetraspora]